MFKKIIKILPAIIVSLAVVAPWFFQRGYLFFTDLAIGPRLIADWHNGYFLLNSLLKLLSFVLPFDALEKILLGLIVGLVFYAGQKLFVATANFTASLNDQKDWVVLSILGGLFALFNPFIYDRLMYGQIGIVASFAFMIMTVVYLLAYLKRPAYASVIGAAIFAGLGLMFSQHAIFFLILWLILFAILFFSSKPKINRLTFIRHLLLALCILIVLNINWLAASLVGSSSTEKFLAVGVTSQDLVAFQTAGKTGGEAVANVLMMSGFWGKDQHRYFDLTTSKTLWGRSFFILLLLILYGFYLGVRSKNKQQRLLSVGLLCLFLISVILAIGLRTNISSKITLFLFNYLPLYKGLRETQKWVAIETIVYLIFLSWGIKDFFQKKIVIQYGAIVKVILAAVIIMQAPLLIWGFGGQVRSSQYPQDWYDVEKIISPAGDCSGGNILFLPWHLYMSFVWVGSIIVNPAPTFFSCPVIIGTNMEWGGIYDNSQSPIGQAVSRWLISDGRTDLLQNSAFDISYIILDKELDWNSYAGAIKNSNLDLLYDSGDLLLYRVKK